MPATAEHTGGIIMIGMIAFRLSTSVTLPYHFNAQSAMGAFVKVAFVHMVTIGHFSSYKNNTAFHHQ